MTLDKKIGVVKNLIKSYDDMREHFFNTSCGRSESFDVADLKFKLMFLGVNDILHRLGGKGFGEKTYNAWFEFEESSCQEYLFKEEPFFFNFVDESICAKFEPFTKFTTVKEDALCDCIDTFFTGEIVAAFSGHILMDAYDLVLKFEEEEKDLDYTLSALALIEMQEYYGADYSDEEAAALASVGEKYRCLDGCISPFGMADNPDFNVLDIATYNPIFKEFFTFHKGHKTKKGREIANDISSLELLYDANEYCMWEKGASVAILTYFDEEGYSYDPTVTLDNFDLLFSAKIALIELQIIRLDKKYHFLSNEYANREDEIFPYLREA